MDSILERLAPVLGPPETAPVAIPAGITNHNYRVRMGGTDYVLRLSGESPELLGIDRTAEVEAQRAAAAAGVAPEVVAHLPEDRCLVIAHVHAHPIEHGDAAGAIPLLAEALRQVHDAPAIRHAFSPFRIAERYLATAEERGVPVPDAAADGEHVAREVERALGPFDPVLCHNDLLPGNVLVDGERLWLIDWEYAGMGDQAFDLGNLSVNNGFALADDEALVRAYYGREDERMLARLRLMRTASGWREGTWGVVQQALSDLDFDYAGYAAEHLRRMLESDWEEWIDGATA